MLNGVLNQFRSIFGGVQKVGIDLGTANTLASIDEKGIVLNEPTIVAKNKNTDQIIAFGKDAFELIGRSPNHIELVKPVRNGVIADVEISTYILQKVFDKISEKSILPYEAVIGVPESARDSEITDIYNATLDAGAVSVNIISEPAAAAVGIGVDILKSNGVMVIDVGGGTTDVSIFSYGGVVSKKSIKCAGDKLNEVIVEYMRNKAGVIIGEKTSEDIKKFASTSYGSTDKYQKISVRGRDAGTGLPIEVTLLDKDIIDAMLPVLDVIVQTVISAMETISPEIASDIIDSTYLVGGGANIKILRALLEKEIGINVKIPKSPLKSVVEGALTVAKNLEDYSNLILKK